MIIELDMNSSIPIYVQLRNQIVMGIGHGELKPGESLPTVRQLAEDAGVNTMTVNKFIVQLNWNVIHPIRRTNHIERCYAVMA